MVRPKRSQGAKVARPKEKVPGRPPQAQKGAFQKRVEHAEGLLKYELVFELERHMKQMLEDEILTDFTVTSQEMEKQVHRAVFQARFHTPEDVSKFDKFLQEGRLALPQMSRVDFDHFLKAVYVEEKVPDLWNYFVKKPDKTTSGFVFTPGKASDATGTFNFGAPSMTEQSGSPFRVEKVSSQPREVVDGSGEPSSSEHQSDAAEREKDGEGNGSSVQPCTLPSEKDASSAGPATSPDQEGAKKKRKEEQGSNAESAENASEEKISDKDFKEKDQGDEKVVKEDLSDKNTNAEVIKLSSSLVERMGGSSTAPGLDDSTTSSTGHGEGAGVTSPTADEADQTLDAAVETRPQLTQNRQAEDTETPQNVPMPGSLMEEMQGSAADTCEAGGRHTDGIGSESMTASAAKVSREDGESPDKSSGNVCGSDAPSVNNQNGGTGDLCSNEPVQRAAEEGSLASATSAEVSGRNEEATSSADGDQGSSPQESEARQKTQNQEEDSQKSEDTAGERENTAGDDGSTGTLNLQASKYTEGLKDADQKPTASAEHPNTLPADSTDLNQSSTKELSEKDAQLEKGAEDAAASAPTTESCQGKEGEEGDGEENKGGPNMSSMIRLSYELFLPHTACSQLGEDLLRLFLQERNPDCELVVSGHRFRAHRCILAARSSYFAAMFAGQWRESSSQEVILEGLNPMALEQALLYLYGGVWELTKECNLADLLHLADMYGMKGLKSAVEFHLRKDFCHYFHLPCADCLARACDALYLAVMYNMECLQIECLDWMNQHFTKVWATRAFASLPEHIQQMASDALIKSLTYDTVIEVILACHKLNSTIPHIKWAEPVLLLATSLLDQCLRYVAQHFIPVIYSPTFASLAKSAAWSGDILEESLGMVIDSLMPGPAVDAYRTLLWLLPTADKEEEDPSKQDFHKMVLALVNRCKTYMRLYISHVTRTNEWTLLSAPIREEILEGASYVCVEPQKRAMPPQLSSSRRIGEKAQASSLVIETMRTDQQYANARDRANGGSSGSSASKSSASAGQDASGGAPQAASTQRPAARRPRPRQAKLPSRPGGATAGAEQGPHGRAPRDDRKADSDAASRPTSSPKEPSPPSGACQQAAEQLDASGAPALKRDHSSEDEEEAPGQKPYGLDGQEKCGTTGGD